MAGAVLVIFVIAAAAIFFGLKIGRPNAASLPDFGAINSDARKDWTTSFYQAMERAKKENKVLLVAFTGSDWCGWCQKLKADVFDTQTFKDWAASRAVLVTCDFPQNTVLDEATKKQNETLARTFGIAGYPTVIVLSSTGEKLGQLGCFEGAAQIIGHKCAMHCCLEQKSNLPAHLRTPPCQRPHPHPCQRLPRRQP